jgi:hypothetical protein
VAVEMAVFGRFRKLVFDANFTGGFINYLRHSHCDEINDR